MRVDYREEPCKTALNRVTGMRFGWSLNPYMGCAHRCTFCYVRGFELRADRPWDERYGTSIRIKTNIVEVLRSELAKRSWKRETVTLGAATDPYQPAEGRYKLSRRCIEALSKARTPFNIITRGPMIVRDIDVLAEASRRVEVSVNFSIPTLDSDVWRKTEPATAPPHQRLRAVSELVRAGVKAGVSVAPVLPGISDGKEQIEAVVRAARDAGATHMWCAVLHLKPGTREYFLDALARDWPALLPGYEEMYEKIYLAKRDAEPIYETFREIESRYEIGDRRETKPAPPPAPLQLALFDEFV
jgi:DNA repair photolyase